MSFILALVGLIPQLIQAGMSIKDLWGLGSEVLARDGEPTAEDWAALRTIEDGLRARLQTPR